MRRLLLAMVAASPLAAVAQEGAPAATPAGAPTGLTASASLAAGGELGLEEGEGSAGVFEVEAAVGWELPRSGLRAELAAAFGLAPDSHFALRPGVRFTLPGYPLQLRVALDAANARDRDVDWRWLLVGVAGELRFTSLLALYAEIDTGVQLSSHAGLPLLARAGASFRF